MAAGGMEVLMLVFTISPCYWTATRSTSLTLGLQALAVRRLRCQHLREMHIMVHLLKQRLCV